jgi:hypothetical protein
MDASFPSGPSFSEESRITSHLSPLSFNFLKINVRRDDDEEHTVCCVRKLNLPMRIFVLAMHA